VVNSITFAARSRVTKHMASKFGFTLLNKETATRLAKALTHAVELCGGGNKDPF
jgi:hypothetical protein